MDEPTIEIWNDPAVVGARGLASRWVNVVGRAHSAAGLYDVCWQLNGQGRRYPLALGSTAYRLVGEGDFNIEFDPAMLEPGINHLDIDAIDRQGRAGSTRLTLRYERDGRCELPLRIDWGKLARIDEAAQVVDGRWALEDGELRTRQIGYDRIVALGSRDWTDYQVRVGFTVYGYSEDPLAYGLPSCGTLVGVVLRWDGHVNWHDLVPYRGYQPYGMLALHVNEFKGATRFAFYDNHDRLLPPAPPAAPAPVPARRLELGRRHWLAASVQSRPGEPGIYRMKAWADGEAEPAEWMFTVEGSTGELAAGSVALVAHQTDVGFGPVEVVPHSGH